MCATLDNLASSFIDSLRVKDVVVENVLYARL
jgi:hypothetical protein